jgi:hypothetical protein
MHEEHIVYVVEAVGGNRFNVVCREPTTIAKDLRWEEAVALAAALNDEFETRMKA